MKKTLILFTLLFSVIFSSASFGDWTWCCSAANGTHEHYIDFEKIKKVDGYTYYWTLADLLEPDKDGDFSYVGYLQGDCKLSRKKNLSEFYYTQPMGIGSVTNNPIKNPEWTYNPPGSAHEEMLKRVCDYVK